MYHMLHRLSSLKNPLGDRKLVTLMIFLRLCLRLCLRPCQQLPHEVKDRLKAMTDQDQQDGPFPLRIGPSEAAADSVEGN